MWEVSKNYLCRYGEYVFQIYKTRKSDDIDHAGNRLYDGRIYRTREAAQARADELKKTTKERQFLSGGKVF